MAKIAMIGAGSVVFAKNLLGDILTLPELFGSTISLMDVDEERLRLVAALARRIVEQEGSCFEVQATLDRREALRGAAYVIVMINVGGLEAIRHDNEIPEQFGVKQCIGDTLGPGGVFKGLRLVPAILEICRDMEELCPDALLMNYSNPMAIICWAVNEATAVKNVGLCHSVQSTAEQLARYIGAVSAETSHWVAGINHMAWFLRFAWKGKDAYPLLFEKMQDPEVFAKDPVRFEIMKQFGYFVTESSYHMSEYVPYFRKRADLLEEFGGPVGHYYRDVYSKHPASHFEQVRREIEGRDRIELKRTHEYASSIIRAMETGEPATINGNTKNAGLVTNLPQGCCVEVPCLVDRNGIHPCYVGELPPQCAALNRSNVSVQELAVKAALHGDREAAIHAVMLDPLTASVCSLREIRQMVDEMLAAEAEFLPQFFSY